MNPPMTSDDLRAVSPALDRFNRTQLLGDVWNRPDLSARDRGIVTVAALVARLQTTEMAYYMNLALDHGVTPSELSEVITHLAFYSGWGNAMTAVTVALGVFDTRGVTAEGLPPATGEWLPIEPLAEAQRADAVEKNIGPVSAALVQYTGELLFHDLWLRPALAPRDRSLVTVSALVASGQVAQIPYHLNRAMDNGLTRQQAAEVLTHLAFYVGWPNVFSAVPVAKSVFDGRAA